MSYSNADIATGLVQPKLIENGVTVPPGLQTGVLTLKEHQDYQVWMQRKPRLTREEAIAAGHRPKEVYEYFGPLKDGEAKLPAQVEAVAVISAAPTSLLAAPLPPAEPADDVVLEMERMAVTDTAVSYSEARQRGYTGEACTDCGNFTMVNNGTCMMCVNCGRTTGCS